MKLERLIQREFNPEVIVSNYEIFGRKSETASDQFGRETERKRFSDDGLFSKRIFGDPEAISEYSCPCGKKHGAYYEDSLCLSCGKKVSFVGPTIERGGWIDLSFSKYENGIPVETPETGFHVIKYIAYGFLEKVLKRENLRNIIHTKNTITVTGDLDMEEITKIRESDPKCKYWYVGIEEFYEKYNEILDYYHELYQNEEEIYKAMKDRDEAFTDKIPVLPIALRPASRTKDGLQLSEINIFYQNILKDCQILKDPLIVPIIRAATIENIQAEYFQLSEVIIDSVKGKNGLIRSQLCGTRINFSARNIISAADERIKIDELQVPYLTFLELYKFELIRIIAETSNISLKDAEKVWFDATLNFNEKLHLIMQEIVKNNEIGVILNRKRIAA